MAEIFYPSGQEARVTRHQRLGGEGMSHLISSESSDSHVQTSLISILLFSLGPEGEATTSTMIEYCPVCTYGPHNSIWNMLHTVRYRDKSMNKVVPNQALFQLSF